MEPMFVILVVLAAVVIWAVKLASKGSAAQPIARFTPLDDDKRSELALQVTLGQLSRALDVHVALRRGEIAHLQLEAELMKDVVDREYRGAHRGVSFRIAKGARYYTGSSRGHMVTVGSHLEVADRGHLTITSQRTVFTGLRRTIEVPHRRIVQIVQMLNGIQLHASNRVNPPMFRVAQEDAAVLASVLDLAYERSTAQIGQG